MDSNTEHPSDEILKDSGFCIHGNEPATCEICHTAPTPEDDSMNEGKPPVAVAAEFTPAPTDTAVENDASQEARLRERFTPLLDAVRSLTNELRNREAEKYNPLLDPEKIQAIAGIASAVEAELEARPPDPERLHDTLVRLADHLMEIGTLHAQSIREDPDSLRSVGSKLRRIGHEIQTAASGLPDDEAWTSTRVALDRLYNGGEQAFMLVARREQALRRYLGR